MQAAVRRRLRESETEVQRAIPHRFAQRASACHLQIKLQPGMPALKVGQHRRQPMRAQGFQRPNRQAAPQLRIAGHNGARIGCQRQQGLGIFHQLSARIGESQLTLRTLEQRHA
ncbi:hypothetical protein ASE26_09735 [Duganella sp. Root198D2]|nr:hypothetical protein ASD07_03060 [Duganella sp. Root336D2]KRB84332.1 hypothetical protein ASE26_09735 [Duganella sp. Root198D2]